jgi:hypothetical protein
MEPTLIIVIIFMIAILGLLIFNSKIDINMLNMAYIIEGIVIISIILLMLTYNSHSECDALINHNNMTLVMLQDKCYQYINF